MGSSELSTVTAVPTWMRSLFAASGGDLRRRCRELATMVFPDPDEIDSYLVGEYALGDEVAKRLRVAGRMTVRVRHSQWRRSARH
jgi:hypothetical protein